MSVFPLSKRDPFISVKGCEGSNSAWLWKVAYAGSTADCGEWAAAVCFQSLCMPLFDQASPGPQDHSFSTSSKVNKAAIISCISFAIADTRDKQRQDPASRLHRAARQRDSETDIDADWEVH